MTSDWSSYLDLRLDRISILPVVPNRLGFAVFVRRALATLGREGEGALTQEDVIAVALPGTMKAPLLAAIDKLPEVSLVVSRARPQEAREVFGVTPGDGIVEAVRWALDHKIPLKFVDREVAPGNLLERDCSSDPRWADDGYLLERGAKAYLDLVRTSLLRAPRRQEPVDTWREVYITLELRRLCARFRRVVFVCQAPHALPIRELLQKGVRWRGLEETSPAVEFEVLQPNLQVRLRYLDDIPRLVERYERVFRRQGNAIGFDKRTALLEELREWIGGSEHERPSPRHLQAFCRLLPAQLRSAGRLTPRLEDCIDLSKCCFDRRFSQVLRDHLLGYFDQVEASRIGLPESRDRKDGSASSVEEALYVARGCNPAQQIFTILPEIPPAIEKPFVWPRWSAHHNAMRRKVYRVSRGFESIQLTRGYSGSIEQGIDIRRTLAAHYRGERQIFVRRTLRQHREMRHGLPEPIVWVFAKPGAQEVMRKRQVQFRGQDHYQSCFIVYKEERTVYAEAKEDGGRIVNVCDVLGAASFFDLSVTLESAKAVFGNGLEEHLPTTAQLQEFSKNPDIWLKELISLALTFAGERIYCVIPQGWTIALPRNGQGREIIEVPAEKLGLHAFEKLSRYCIVEGGRKVTAEMSDEFSRELIERYAEIVDTKWP